MAIRNLLFSFIIVLSSCVYDPPYPYAEVVNNSNAKALLELYFDSAAYKPYWTKHNFRIFLTHTYGFSEFGPETKLISIDTVKLVQFYLISPMSTFSIDGWGERNNSVLYDKIKVVHKRDTFDLKNLNEIKKAFKTVNKNTSRFEIK